MPILASLSLAFVSAYDVSPIVTNASTTFGTDPTETTSRIEFTGEWQDRQHGDEAGVLNARFDVGLFERYIVRADVPVARVTPEGASSDDGLGDARVQIGWRAFDDRVLSMLFGVGVVFDTADGDLLGEGRNQLVPMLAASGDLPEIRSRLYETIEHFVSFSGDADRGGVAYTKTQVRLMTAWSDALWTQVGGTFVIDWKGGEHTGLALDVEVGRTFGEHIGAWIRPGVSVFGEDVPGIVDWSVQVGVSWLF